MSVWLAYEFRTYSKDLPFDSDITILGIFSTREKAQDRIKKYAKENGVESSNSEENIILHVCSAEKCEIAILERTLDEECEHEL